MPKLAAGPPVAPAGMPGDTAEFTALWRRPRILRRLRQARPRRAA